MARMYAFLDTNVLLQFRPFQEIDWPAILGSDEVELVIAKVIFTELDQQKNGDNPRLRDGARRVRHELEDRLDDSPAVVRPGVWLSFRLQHPEHILAETPSLSAQINDDVLVASMLSFRNEYAERDSVLVSDDGGPRVTARSFGFRVFEPPDDLRLPDKPDPTKQELIKTQRELQRLRGARPKLDVRFAGLEPGAPLYVTLMPAEAPLPGALATAVEAERQHRSLVDSPVSFASFAVQMMSPAQRERYSRDLETYLTKYRQHLLDQWDYQETKKRSFIVNLEVWNTGTSVADDVDVNLHFPDGFSLDHVEEDEEAADSPSAPAPPSMPLTPMQELMQGSRLPLIEPRFTDFSYLTQDTVRSLNPSSFHIRRSESYDLEKTVQRIKPGTRFAFNALRVQFDSDASVVNFHIHHSLHALLLTEPVEGDLDVIVTR